MQKSNIMTKPLWQGNGVDNIVFTAGVGENDSDIRQEICEYLEFLGITIDEVRNREQGEAFRISDGTSRVNVLVVRTNEELEIARETAAVAREVIKTGRTGI